MTDPEENKMETIPVRRAPCPTCPYRTDTPPGVWAAHEYEKLRDYDLPTGEQPTARFDCHYTNLGDEPQVCRGWVDCHNGRHDRGEYGFDLLALRISPFMAVNVDGANLDHDHGVEVYPNGNAAADAGLAGVEDPDSDACAVIGRLERRAAKKTTR